MHVTMAGMKRFWRFSFQNESRQFFLELFNDALLLKDLFILISGDMISDLFHFVLRQTEGVLVLDSGSIPSNLVYESQLSSISISSYFLSKLHGFMIDEFQHKKLHEFFGDLPFKILVIRSKSFLLSRSISEIRSFANWREKTVNSATFIELARLSVRIESDWKFVLECSIQVLIFCRLELENCILMHLRIYPSRFTAKHDRSSSVYIAKASNERDCSSFASEVAT